MQREGKRGCLDVAVHGYVDDSCPRVSRGGPWLGWNSSSMHLGNGLSHVSDNVFPFHAEFLCGSDIRGVWGVFMQNNIRRYLRKLV